MHRDIPGYHIKDQIGRGDICAVYRAVDSDIDRDVALKVLLDESPIPENDRRRYFDQEARALALLDHPHIPALYTYAEGDLPYIATQLIEGQDAGMIAAAQSSFLPIKRVIRWGIQICDALDHLHNLKPDPLVFRDLKPSNIMVDTRDNAYLVDFNLAITLPGGAPIHDAELIGTPGFAAPEQYQGTVSPLVDIYALGATLHYLLTLRDPRLEDPFTFHLAPPASLNPAVSPALEAVVLRTVSFEPDARHSSVQALKAALLACQ